MKEIKWGIRGTGHIANRFAEGLMEVEGSRLTAVASRHMESAQAFSKKFKGDKVYDDFDQMLDEADIDVVYIATPNNFHFDEVMKALDAGINVLCEKPMVDNHEQLMAIKNKAKEKNLFLMEGMWSRFFPAMRQAAKWVADGKIGDVINIKADFSYALDPENDQPWKAGNLNNAGALRDVGIYSIAFADLFFPELPIDINFSMYKEDGVDQRNHLFLDYGDARVAFLSSAFTHHGSSTAEVVGSEGTIQVGPEFWRPQSAKIIRNMEVIEEFTDDYPATGFQYEAAAVAECLRKGEQEAEFYSWADTERIAEIIEKIRKAGGVFYPSDKL